MAGYLTLAELRSQISRDIERLRRDADKWYTEKPNLLGLTSGIARLDDFTGGLVMDEVIVIGGDPGGGKTSLMMQAVEASADQSLREGLGLYNLVISAEMSRKQLYMRSACRLAHVDSHALRKGNISESEKNRFFAALEALNKLPLLVLDRGMLTSEDTLNAARILRDEGIPLGVIAVDYIQQLYDDGANDTQRIPLIMRNLIAAKGETGACMLLLSQYSRAKHKEHRPPELEDLLGSGNIGRACDQAWLLHNPEVPERLANMVPEAFRTELYIRKNRNGRQGKLSLWYCPSQTRFFSEMTATAPAARVISSHPTPGEPFSVSA